MPKTRELFSTRTLIDDLPVLSAEKLAFRISASLDQDQLYSEGKVILNDAFQQLQSPANLLQSTKRVWDQFQYLRQSAAPEHWNRFILDVVQPHPLKQMVLEDPCTLHSTQRPRGYPGDATLLDYYYGFNDVPTATSSTGLEILKVNVNVPAAWAIRVRLKKLSEAIDHTLQTREKPRILSIACGHLREALDSVYRTSTPHEFIALDHDPQSLDLVRTQFGSSVTTVSRSVFGMLRGKDLGLGQFDLIYASGLYDYLEKPVAIQLTAYLMNYLNPGGRLIITNFLTQSDCAGYLEAFMDWYLVYRTMTDLNEIFEAVNLDQGYTSHTYIEENGVVGFLEITKKNQISD